MARSRGGLIALIVGIVCILAGFALAISSVFPLISQFEPLAQMQSPGVAEVRIEEAGPYTLWHDHLALFDGKTVSSPAALPTDFTFVFTRKEDGSQVPLDPIRSRSTVSFGSRESVAIGTFSPGEAGTYSLEVRNPSEDARVFSLTQGSLLHGMAQFGLRLVLGLILGGGGLVLLILGIVFMVRGAKARPAAPASPLSPPPPPPLAG